MSEDKIDTAKILEENKRLREENETNSRFFSVSLDMLCISSFDGHFKRVNPAFETVLGFTQEEMCTHPYLFFVHPDDIQKTSQEVEKQLSQGQKVLSFENRYRHKDGSYRILSWKSVPIGDLMYAAARDVTESRQNEDALKQAKADLETSNRDLESFSYSVAHDLRAPLRSTMGFSNILLEDFTSSLNEEAKSLLNKIINASNKMELLIDGLLSLSRWSRKDPVKQLIHLSETVQTVANELQQAQPERKVKIEIASDVDAVGDPQLTAIVIENLMSNAWKYTARNTGEQRIEFGVLKSGELPTYFIKDNGAGFDMKYVDKLFGTFQRLHTESEFEGIGIGLATVKRIVQRQGGEIWAQGEVGKGATFSFTLGSSIARS